MNLVIQYGTKVVGVILLLILAFIIAGWVKRLTNRALTKAKIDLTLTKFFSNMARYVVLIMALLSCFTLFGIDVTSFAALIAAAGFAIGMAFQGTLSNFSAGVMLLVFRPFKVGDVIEVDGVAGGVQEIELFTTHLDTLDNRRIIVPNSAVFGAKIDNATFHSKRRVDVGVGTDYGANLRQTKEILEKAASSVASRMTDEPVQAYLVELGDSAIVWDVRVWCDPAVYWDVREELTFAVKEHLDNAGIGIPYPQMDVHVDGVIQD